MRNTFHECESDWKKANKRRGELIKKESSDTLSSVEQEELDELQAYADCFLDREAPPDYCRLNELIRQQGQREEE